MCIFSSVYKQRYCFENRPSQPPSPHSLADTHLLAGEHQDLHDFLQTLFAPWGFGKDYHASDREVRAHIRRLQLRIFNDNKVHFKASFTVLLLSSFQIAWPDFR